jgi:hypothetical protein
MQSDLRSSPDDTTIQFCNPNATFDPKWMDGVGREGRHYRDDDDIGSLEVALCLFPAIFRQEGMSLPEKAIVADALTKNQFFFLSAKERMDIDPPIVTAALATTNQIMRLNCITKRNRNDNSTA